MGAAAAQAARARRGGGCLQLVDTLGFAVTPGACPSRYLLGIVVMCNCRVQASITENGARPALYSREY